MEEVEEIINTLQQEWRENKEPVPSAPSKNDLPPPPYEVTPNSNFTLLVPITKILEQAPPTPVFVQGKKEESIWPYPLNCVNKFHHP